MFWCRSWILKMFSVTFHSERTYIKKRGWLLHYNTGTKAKSVTSLLKQVLVLRIQLSYKYISQVCYLKEKNNIEFTHAVQHHNAM